MKEIVKIFQFLLLMCGVFGADEDEVSVSVMEGDSVTLNPDLTKIQGFIQILWRFGSQGSTIAAVDDEILYENEEIFKDRLQLDQTGSLTIKNMKTKHSGRYKAEISHSAGALFTQFIVTVYESPAVIDPAKGAMKIVSVTEGDPVTLQTDVTELQGDELIVWRSGDEGKLIAKHDTEAKSSLLYDTDERFRDRLMVENKTGSLIITNTRTTDSGLYKVKISSRKQTLYKRFTVTVSDSGVSPAAVAGIVVFVLLASAAAAAAVMYFRRPRTTKLPTQTWSVPEGDNVTLNPDTEIQTSDEIQWLFGAEDTLIAGIKGEKREMNTYQGPDGIFMNRLKLDETTGSLTIEYIFSKRTGLYTLKIGRGKETLYKRFMVSIEERMISAMEGESVTLYSDTVIQRGDEMQWLFEDEEQTVLAEIKTTAVTKYEGPDERFRDRLELNKETGSLTVTKYTAAHTGVYTLKIRRGTETSYKRFFISVEPRMIEVTEGDLVTLKPATEINKDDSIRWLFRDEEQQTLIAEIKGETREIFTHDDAAGGRFRGRLKLDETGSLTINNTRTSHSGVYKLQITSSRGVSEQTFIVTVKVEEKSLTEGGSVTLNPDTEIQRDDQILWMFGAEDHLIAQIRGGTVEIYDDGVNKRFRDRLQLDETGSLTITDITAKHTGRYKLLTISSSRETLFKKFKVSIHLRDKTVTAGDSVALKTGFTGKHTADEIQWRFGDEDTLIAAIKGGTGKTHDVPDERFRDRLELNNTTGDLIIKNSASEHAGCYKLKICSSEGKRYRTFIVFIRGAAVTDESRKKSETKKKNDSRENRVNESATVEMPLLNGDDLDEVNEEEGMSSL